MGVSTFPRLYCKCLVFSPAHMLHVWGPSYIFLMLALLMSWNEVVLVCSEVVLEYPMALWGWIPVTCPLIGCGDYKEGTGVLSAVCLCWGEAREDASQPQFRVCWGDVCQRFVWSLGCCKIISMYWECVFVFVFLNILYCIQFKVLKQPAAGGRPTVCVEILSQHNWYIDFMLCVCNFK